MAADLTIGQGQTLPQLTATITDQSGNVINLTGGSVTFVMRGKFSTTTTTNAAATIVSPSAGTVSYTFTATDTATPGLYRAQFLVTESGGGLIAYPNQGYLEIEIQENLTGSPERLVDIADVKDVLNMPATDRVHDTKILRWIDAARPLIENITGPIIPATFDEYHDGGQYYITLRHAPSTGYGTTPICNLAACSFYIGPIEYQAAIIPSPDFGQIYSVMLDTDYRVVRRGPGGAIMPFPNSLQNVHVVYQAGQSSIPANVYEGTIEYLRVNYQATAQALRRAQSRGEDMPAPPVGYAVPNRVRDILVPTRRAPSIW